MDHYLHQSSECVINVSAELIMPEIFRAIASELRIILGSEWRVLPSTVYSSEAWLRMGWTVNYQYSHKHWLTVVRYITTNLRPTNSIDIVLNGANIVLQIDGSKTGVLATFDMADPDFDVLMIKNMILVAYQTRVVY